MQLHGILPPLEVVDYTYLYLFGAILVLGSLLYFIYKRFIYTPKKGTAYYLRLLEQCDFQDAKKTALQFSHYGQMIFTKQQAQFQAIQSKLEPYKYLKNSPELPKKLQKEITQILQDTRQNHVG